MAPKRPRAPAAPAVRRDGVVEEIRVVQTGHPQRKDGSARVSSRSRSAKDVTTYRPRLPQPKVQGREVEPLKCDLSSCL